MKPWAPRFQPIYTFGEFHTILTSIVRHSLDAKLVCDQTDRSAWDHGARYIDHRAQHTPELLRPRGACANRPQQPDDQRLHRPLFYSK
jgi:hypothetical protein